MFNPLTCTAAGMYRCTGPAQQHAHQMLEFKRLAHMVIHASGQTSLPVAGHCVGSHGHKWAPLKWSRLRMACVACKPSITGICMSISTRSYPLG